MADFMKKEYELAKIHKAFGFHGHSDIITVSVVGISLYDYFTLTLKFRARSEKAKKNCGCAVIYFYRSALTWLAISPFNPYPPPLQTFYSSWLKGKKRLVTPLTATLFLYTTLTYIGSHFTQKTPTCLLLTTERHVRFEINCSPLCPRILSDRWIYAVIGQ